MAQRLEVPHLRTGIVDVNGSPAVVAWTGTEPFVSVSHVVADGRIEQVLIVRDPDELGGWSSTFRRAPRLRRVTQPAAREPAAHVERVLCVLAHPDDVDFGSAGTVASWTSAGTEVTYCIVTDGDAGGFDETPRERIPVLRRAEQQAAAATVGVTDVRFLGYPDGRLEPTLDLRRDISRVIRQVRPQRVLTTSPERFWDRIGASHPDHLTVGESTLRAVYPDARNPFAFPELLEDDGLEAWTVSEVWLGSSPRADHAVDVTEMFDRKLAALRCHVTQVSHMPDLEKMLTAWMGQTAARFGLPEGRLAEAFHVVHTT